MKGPGDLTMCICGHPEMSHTARMCRRKGCGCTQFAATPEDDGFYEVLSTPVPNEERSIERVRTGMPR